MTDVVGALAVLEALAHFVVSVMLLYPTIIGVSVE